MALRPKRFDKLLIANRGEIACRIMRTGSRMRLRTVAVYSEADRNALHVALADEAVAIGAAPAKQSYLNIGAIIAAARQTGAGAIHPGYGFLAESADFAQACADAGIVFVGPAAETIRLMGSKSAAKARMQSSGVPIVPGYHGGDQSMAALTQAADRVGYPVLVKASAGGGGRGMRLVHGAGELAEAVAGAKREALGAFGDDELLIEKFIARPRHIEVQVFGDMHGNVVSLYERECTLQRRHQKVVEEAPSIAVTPERRAQMSAAARAAAAAVSYVNAGTVEFIADEAGFYFIEMNTRLQVEHPVTEMIIGADLVECQLRVARGEKLPLHQDAIAANGHAVEARIYAEDARKGFLPATGTITRWREPAGEGVRVDTGFRQGDAVTPYYDALLAKLITRGSDRAEALRRMLEALGELEIEGVTTNLDFLKSLLAHPRVARGEIDTGFIERELSSLLHSQPRLAALDMAAACAALLLRERNEAASDPSPWNRSDGWMLAGRRFRRVSFRPCEHGGDGHHKAPGDRYDALLWYESDGLRMDFAGAAAPLSFSARAARDSPPPCGEGLGVGVGVVDENRPTTTPLPNPPPPELGSTRVRHSMWPKSDKSDFGWGREPTETAAHNEPTSDKYLLDVTLGEATQACTASWSGRELHLTTPRAPLCLCWIDPFSGKIGEAAAETRIVAPMPGTVTRILAEVGAELARGAPLIVLEAMKMEHILRAPADGHLKALKCAVGDFVQEGTDLADFDAAAD
jgi:3-methylcrotonyl-CoA carboxylase alpha subunit